MRSIIVNRVSLGVLRSVMLMMAGGVLHVQECFGMRLENREWANLHSRARTLAIHVGECPPSVRSDLSRIRPLPTRLRTRHRDGGTTDD